MSYTLIDNDTGKDIIETLRLKDEEIERLNNIIKEAREYIKSHTNNCMFELRIEEMEELLEILDKAEENIK